MQVLRTTIPTWQHIRLALDTFWREPVSFLLVSEKGKHQKKINFPLSFLPFGFLVPGQHPFGLRSRRQGFHHGRLRHGTSPQQSTKFYDEVTRLRHLPWHLGFSYISISQFCAWRRRHVYWHGMAVGSGRLAFWQIGLPTLRVHRSLGKGRGWVVSWQVFFAGNWEFILLYTARGAFSHVGQPRGKQVLENNKHVYMYNFCF